MKDTMTFQDAQHRVRAAEKELGPLTRGQRVDLLADAYPGKHLRTIQEIVAWIEAYEAVPDAIDTCVIGKVTEGCTVR